ncbi:adenylate/guanylate cyclase domain-containing protein [Thioclava sp. NG1]|uniref:adenylate/guanylate cyclase domain-containing protein n=1 Tax=Thioclava sp. NG1 TaxID=2182426 RepID=UPI000D621C44|nr:adenylate/guanylate cyclase domain-containing protein [Thioclava sp. NG1]PWE48782.1 adenylate/guanylate cyclase domain-containing protein [Thioclava sp. NG1]
MGLKSDLEEDVKRIYSSVWTRRKGQKVPEDTDLKAGNDAVDLQATILYTDLDESTKLVDNYNDEFAAENYKTFLQCATKIIRSEGGHIRSFDGDRVMGVFIGGSKNTSAVRCGLKINYAVKQIIQPKMNAQYNTKYVMKHVTGIDSTNVMVAKAGIRNSNDLVWIGKAANHAAKLSAMSSSHPTWISDKVYDGMSDDVKYSKGINMWEERKWTAQNNRRIYRSTYWWSIS